MPASDQLKRRRPGDGDGAKSQQPAAAAAAAESETEEDRASYISAVGRRSPLANSLLARPPLPPGGSDRTQSFAGANPRHQQSLPAAERARRSIYTTTYVNRKQAPAASQTDHTHTRAQTHTHTARTHASIFSSFHGNAHQGVFGINRK